MGHRRLSIIDTSAAGHQPFTDEGGRYTMVFNGEVFNFQNLRADLEARGESFRSRTDTEVVLRLFALEGPSFLHRLNGFFAFAIHDAVKDTLFLARDRYGVKPLVWRVADGAFHFASELRALLALCPTTNEDPASRWCYFRQHYIPAPHTILEGTHKLLPGHSITVGTSAIDVTRWYDLEKAIQGSPRIAPDTLQNDLFNTLENAVELRLISDVPIGTFLSGGLDSSIVSALARRHHSSLRTFSIGYADDPYFDETRHAEEVARHIGSEHTTFSLTRADLAGAYTELLGAIDEPFADSSALPSYVLCKRTREHVTVALSGDGADEIFGGYRKHQAALRMHRPGAMEKAVIALAPLWRSLPGSRNNALSDRVRQLHRFARAARLQECERYLELAAFEDAGSVTELTGTALPKDRLAGFTGAFDGAQGPEAWLRNDLDLVLPNDMLHKVDMTSMAHALEVRTPFLDLRVVELAFGLTAAQRFQRGTGKKILRDVFGHLLPPGILTRAKKGFEVPLRDLFLGPLEDLMLATLTRERCERHGLRWSAVERQVKRLRSADPGSSQATVHALIVYLSWWERNGR